MDLVGLGVLFALVAVNAVFVAAEYALVTVRRTRIQQLVEEGRIGARVVQQAIQNLDTMIAAIQVGITMVSLAIGWAGEPALSGFFLAAVSFVPEPYLSTFAHTVATLLSFVAATAITVVLGELTPKTIARQRSEQTALLLIPPLVIFERVLHPFVWLLTAAGRLVQRLLGLTPEEDATQHIHSVEELRLLVEASGEAGVLGAEQEQMVERIFDFTLWKAHEVMVPRTQMDAVPVDITLAALIDLTTTTRHTRYPVYQDTVDNIIGVIHVKDLITLTARGAVAASFNVGSLMQDVLMAPETISANRLLSLMRQQRRHLVERIVGEVHDEFETAEEAIAPLPDGTFRVKGMVPVRDIEERFDLEVEDEMIDTIGGLVFAELGRQAAVGDAVTIQGVRMEVTEIDGLRINLVRVWPRMEHPAPDEARDAGVA
ncbi:MAG: hemolysin family protein [Chloroflexi bacterium]|nr:hemolysin family protein [Chloroflexota bacterium]